MPEIVARKRVRTQPAPEPRKRVRRAPEAAPEAVVEQEKPQPDGKQRWFTPAEAEMLAGKPGDPVASGLFSTESMTTCCVQAQTDGDGMIGKMWRRPDGSYMVWGITLDGYLKYLGRFTGASADVYCKLSNAVLDTAKTRAKMRKPPKHYEKWRTA